jgi:hypothetical protein
VTVAVHLELAEGRGRDDERERESPKGHAQPRASPGRN